MTQDAAVTAAAEAIHVTAFQALGDAAEAVVAAVRPIIEAEVRAEHDLALIQRDGSTYTRLRERWEAEVRERIAAEIGAMTLKQIGMGVSLFDAARDQAARIARGQT